jgi:hypothetical protein
MEEPMVYEKFPGRIVLLSNLLTVSIYGIGACLMAGLGIWALAAYIVYCGWIELRVLRQGCVNCCYYGKTCAFGKGRLCALLATPSGSPRRKSHGPTCSRTSRYRSSPPPLPSSNWSRIFAG